MSSESLGFQRSSPELGLGKNKVGRDPSISSVEMVESIENDDSQMGFDVFLGGFATAM